MAGAREPVGERAADVARADDADLHGKPPSGRGCCGSTPRQPRYTPPSRYLAGTQRVPVRSRRWTARSSRQHRDVGPLLAGSAQRAQAPRGDGAGGRREGLRGRDRRRRRAGSRASRAARSTRCSPPRRRASPPPTGSASRCSRSASATAVARARRLARGAAPRHPRLPAHAGRASRASRACYLLEILAGGSASEREAALRRFAAPLRREPRALGPPAARPTPRCSCSAPACTTARARARARAATTPT